MGKNCLPLNIAEIASLEDEFEKFIYNYVKNTPIIFYGCGVSGSNALQRFVKHKIQPIAVCDNNPNKWGKPYHGLIITQFEETLKKYPDLVVYISAGVPKFQKEIREQLEKLLPNEKILPLICPAKTSYNLLSYKDFILKYATQLETVYNALCDEKSKVIFQNILKGSITYKSEYFKEAYSTDQYFADFMKLSENEVFLDCGAFIGDTFLEFYEKTNGKFEKYYAFEPDKRNLEKLRDTIEIAKDRVVLLDAGVFDKNNGLYFDTQITIAGAKISNEGKEKINVVSLDSFIGDSEVTFIKMDVEGSELPALRGAENLIKKHKPKLAICVYHKDEDLFKIPQYIMSLGLDYKYYLRHHSFGNCDTVFYAI